MKIVFTPIWSWPAVVLAIVALLAVVLTTYPARVRHVAPFWRQTLIGLRMAAAVVLAVAMLRPEIQHTETDRKAAVLAVLGDASRSMSTEDGVGGISRRQALLNTLEDAQPHFKTLNENVELRYFDFARQLDSAPQAQPDAAGDQTAIGAILDELPKQVGSRRLVGAVLMTDGAQRALAPHDTDPRLAARRLGERQIPVYAVPFGTSGLTGSSLDLAVEDLLVDSLAFEKKIVPVSARIRVLGAANRKLTVRLLVEDRTGKGLGEAGELKVPPATRNTVPIKTIEVSENAAVVPVDLSFLPEQPGEYKLALEVVPLEGELKTANNRQSTLITVRKGGIRVAYFDILRPEQKFIRGVNAEQIQLDWIQVRTGAFQSLTKIDPELFAPDKYDAYIIGDVPASVFGPDLLDKLADRVFDGAGLMMTGGFHSFGPGGYAETPLEDLLPVRMSPLEVQNAGEIATDLHHLTDLQMLPTSRGLRHYLMRIDAPDENRARWAALFPLQSANKLEKKNELVEVLAATDDGVPLLFAHEVGQARVLAFAGDTTWLWVSHGDAAAHQRFWRQVILWLSRKEQDEDQEVWVRVDPRNFNPGARVPIMFGAQTPEGDPIPDVDFDVEVITPDGTEQQLTPQRRGDQHSADFLNTQAPGDYWVRVTARKDGTLVGFDAMTRFIVDARDLEMDNPAADPALLQEIAQITGGAVVPPEEFSDFLARLIENDALNPEETYVTRVSLWDNWYFLLTFVGLMTVEWFLRKKRGLV